MNALLLKSKKEGLYCSLDHPVPQAEKGEALIKLSAAALNHRDVWITQGLYPGIQPNIILGSDGVGEYEGKMLLINPAINWGSNEAFPAPEFNILGMPTHGTFAQYISVSKDRLHDKPRHLTISEAAALPLAGLTAYRAVFIKGQLQKGQRVFISGIGGGVALMAAQFALAAGAEVYVSSGSDEKIEKAIKLGAKGGVNYKTADWKPVLKTLGGTFDLIIDSAAGQGFGHLLKLAAPGARLVIYGGTDGFIPKLSPQLIFWKQLSILGTSMGSDNDFKNMLTFVDRHKIKPLIDRIYPLKDGMQAFQRMAAAKQFGKIVLTIA